jgi:uncharacterized protein
MCIIEELERIVTELVGKADQSVAHRMDHMQRVRKNAKLILPNYPEVQEKLLDMAILLHDVEQPFYDKANHVARSTNLARKILSDLGVENIEISRVCSIIEEHSTEHIDRIRPSSMEARILFDADKIDGVGASGVIRVFALHEQLGKGGPKAISWYRKKIDTARRNMQTPEGRAIFEDRLKLVEAFLSSYEEENGIVGRLNTLREPEMR